MTIDSLTPEQLEIFHALQRDNMHMSNEDILELMQEDVCEEAYVLDEDIVYADI